jgi:hypothetical protein
MEKALFIKKVFPGYCAPVAVRRRYNYEVQRLMAILSDREKSLASVGPMFSENKPAVDAASLLKSSDRR